MPTTGRCPRATPIPIEPERCRNEMRRRRRASEHGAFTRWDDSSPDEYTRRAQRDEARRNIIGRSTKTDESPRHPNRAASSTLGSLTSAAGRSAVQATPCLALALDKRCHRPVAVRWGSSLGSLWGESVQPRSVLFPYEGMVSLLVCAVAMPLR